MLKRCQDMRTISINLGGTVGSRYIADIETFATPKFTVIKKAIAPHPRRLLLASEDQSILRIDGV